MSAVPLATGVLFGRAWSVHRVVGCGLGEFPDAFLEWSWDDEPVSVRQARRWADGDDGKVWARAARMPEVAAAIDQAKTAWQGDGGPERQRRFAAESLRQAAELRAEAEASGRRCFLRIGAPPASGRSLDHRDGRAEDGVSVYAGWCLPGDRYVIDLRGVDVISSLFIISDDAPVYEVTGTVLDTVGSDGEPLLTQARARRVHPTGLTTVL